MIVDTEEELNAVLQYIKSEKCLVVPILTDHQLHTVCNKISCIYVYCESGIERIIPIHHSEQIRGFTERLSDFLSMPGIYIYDKKEWLNLGGNSNCYDVKTLWWYTYGESYDEPHYFTAAHKFYWRRHKQLNHVNTIVPLMQHLAMCQKIRQYAWPMILNSKLTDSYITFNTLYPEVFSKIERSGLAVNEHFKMPELITDNKVYTRYQYFTATGRPSNAFRGFNFAAMNKEDGTRSAFCSRFDRGVLVEMDFDSYHVRLIARLIGYQLPLTSVHDYLGQYYFDKSTLTEQEREESKSITFRLLYGGIDREFLTIPFFQRVNDFVYTQWNAWKKHGYILSALDRRPITMDGVERITANKLFNYFLQSLETEVSVRKLKQITEYLQDKQSKLVLYTYDSILVDVSPDEMYVENYIQTQLEQGGFPIKIKRGVTYDKMTTEKILY